ncbi:MAG TPA: hypothetical protein DHW71_11565 [Gammaproteobacteria bacterium]|nr:hypothetical protein [Gammaproteobacteria bacterium]
MSELLTALADKLGAKIAKKYRVPAETARDMVLVHWQQKQDLLKLVAESSTEKAVARTRIYKDPERDVTRKVYYELRRYQAEQSVDPMIDELRQSQEGDAREKARLALVQNHVSTAERMSHLDEFWTQIKTYWGEPSSLLDLGCGLLPLVYPYADHKLDRYLALDRSTDSINTIQAFKEVYGKDMLETHEWKITDGWDVIGDQSYIFDVALMLKFVPVVARQEPESLNILGQVPARKVIITGCKTAMVKQQDISRRERASILAFAEEQGLDLLDEFETPDEVGFVFQRNI